MNLSEQEIATLNEFLNGQESLPVDVEAINVKLREHFSQDTSVETPEVEAAVSEAEAATAPVEEVPASETPVAEAPAEPAPTEEVPA